MQGASSAAGLTCPVCQTVNEPSRTFCRKCASRLVPGVVVKRPLLTPGVLLRFGLGLVIGAGMLIGGAAVITRLRQDTAAAPAPVTIPDESAVPRDFALVAGNPQPIPPLPVNATIQLAAFTEPAKETAAPGTIVKAPWWNADVPRVPAVTQFDGGPLENVNCVMASGAMLARLAFGIVTTGSQLRALQSDQEGATNFGNLNDAVQRGWGVHFLRGSLTALQLRALSYNGAGVVIALDYGLIPVGVRLQSSFTGGHAIYIDAFRPGGPEGPAGYYVLDPIGHSWQGYKGGWWPAAAVERAAIEHGGGLIDSTWAFAGGRIPDVRKTLPPDAYPSPPASGEPTGADQMPTTDLPVVDDTPVGEPPPDTPTWRDFIFRANVFEAKLDNKTGNCTTQPIPPGCPFGIVGIVDLAGLSASAPPSSDIRLLYANAIAPGTYQIIFDSPVGADASLWLWIGAGALQPAKVEQAFLGGDKVNVATVSLDPDAPFSFFASATIDGVRSVSSVGTMAVKQ